MAKEKDSIKGKNETDIASLKNWKAITINKDEHG